MQQDNENLLNTVIRVTDMGKATLDQMIPMAERPEFKAELMRQQNGYRSFGQQAHTALDACGVKAQGQGMVEKWMAKAGIAGRTITDRSTHKLAGMLVEGNQMGVNECVTGLKDCPRASTGAVELTRQLQKFEEQNIENLRQFL